MRKYSLLFGFVTLACALHPGASFSDDQDTSTQKTQNAGEIEKEDREISKGVRYSSFSCESTKGKIAIRALTLEPSSTATLRLYDNPSVHPTERNPYVGEALPEWILNKKKTTTTLGATNANFFGIYEKQSYRSTGLLYSRAITPQLNSPLRVYPLKKTDRPLTPSGGEELVVYGERTLHRMVIVPSCDSSTKTCQVKIDPSQSTIAPESLTTFQSTDDFKNHLIAAFPNSEWIMQLTMPLMDKKRFACSSEYPSRCRYAARTLLCVKPDQSIVLATTSSAMIEELAEITQTTSKCELKCRLAYNLDGGGSTQMLVKDTEDKLKMVQGGPDPRPVHNLLLIESK